MNQVSLVAGSPADFLTVRHLVARGSQHAIGRALAEEARTRSDWRPPSIDPTTNRARWTWFERNWPEHHARMRGAAEVLGVDPKDHTVCLDGIAALPQGCSATWYPPSASADGRGWLGRNYDFFTMAQNQLMDTLAGRTVTETAEPPMASRPYVITTVPDEGLAATAITMLELDSCMEGINEAGLSVALLLADIEGTGGADIPGPQAGLDVSQVVRFLLDTCASVDEAQQALLGAKQYDKGAPCHYLIADASGRGFVWERGGHGSEHIVEWADGPLCVTNHLLHKHPDLTALPEDNEETFETYQRIRTLSKRTSETRMSPELLRDALDEVAIQAVPGLPWRTLWRTVFDIENRSMSVRFYLGDNQDQTVRLSEETVFTAARSALAG